VFMFTYNALVYIHYGSIIVAGSLLYECSMHTNTSSCGEHSSIL
jgi:hypothetical protein